MSKVVVFDAITQTETVRDMTADELAQWEIDKAAAEAEKQAAEEAAAKRKALLNKLGITEEEAKLLLS